MSSKKSRAAQVSPSVAVRNLRIDMSPSERLVLYALAARMQTLDSEVWPSMQTIALDTSLSESTARRAVHSLLESKILSEQTTDRRTKTFKIVIPTPVTMTGHPSNLTPLDPCQDESDGSQIDREGCHGDRGMGVMVTGEDQSEGSREGSIEDQAKRVAVAPSTGTTSTATATIDRIRSAILSDPELAKICTPDAVAEVAAEYARHANKIDALQTIHSAGDYLRTDAGKKIRNGRDHLLRRLQWAQDKAAKQPRPKKATPPPPLVRESDPPVPTPEERERTRQMFDAFFRRNE